MSNLKRTADSAPTTSSKKRKVTVTTFNKWKTQFERDHQILLWLRCDVNKEDKTVVECGARHVGSTRMGLQA